MDMISLQSFIMLIETGSFTRAADRVGRTQSAVSQQINKLEATLGKKLLLRGKSVRLTQEGEIFLNYARKIFALHCEMVDRFKEPELEGELRFGLPEDFASVFLSDVLADFARTHPRVLLKVECDLTLNLFERFKRNEFDLVLVKMNTQEDFPNGVEVWSEPLEWVGNPELVSFDKPIPLVLAPSPCVYRARAIEALESQATKWRIVFSSHSFAGTIAAVRADMGITVLPRNMVPDDLHTIRQTDIMPELDDTHISLIKHNKNNAAVNSLENFVLGKMT